MFGGPNSNSSIFVICGAPVSWMDSKHVVFGWVIEGKSVLSKMEEVGTRSGTPSAEVVITYCGQIPCPASHVPLDEHGAEVIHHPRPTCNRLRRPMIKPFVYLFLVGGFRIPW